MILALHRLRFSLARLLYAVLVPTLLIAGSAFGQPTVTPKLQRRRY